MSKRHSFYGLVAVGSLCVFVLLLNQRYNSSLEFRQQPMIPVGRPWQDVEIRTQNAEIQDAIMDFRGLISNATSHETHEVIERQRRIIEEEMEGYHFPNGKYGINTTKLEDLIMEEGGRPMRSIILTTWRSGSTFFGDVLNAHPANFYHYEPLLDFGIVQVRGPPFASTALSNLKALLNCEYEDLDHYLDYGQGHVWLFNHNTQLWRQCVAHKKLCWDPKFLTAFCRLFPFQSMKVVRLRLRLAEELLEDTSLAVRLILLVRDPRGTLQSRKHREWCPGNPDCADPALLCADMVADFNAAVTLIQKYPNRFRVVRYEDLSVEPYKYVQELYDFYGLDFHPNVKYFLDSHTKIDVGGVSSTFRNSKAAPFHWRSDLEFEEVEHIQQSCAAAMHYWGYVPAMNATHQKDFNPITDYQLTL